MTTHDHPRTDVEPAPPPRLDAPVPGTGPAIGPAPAPGTPRAGRIRFRGLLAVSLLSAVLGSGGTAAVLQATRAVAVPTSTANAQAAQAATVDGDLAAVVAAARESVVTITANGASSDGLSPFSAADARRRVGRGPHLERLHPHQPPRRRGQQHAHRRVLRRARAARVRSSPSRTSRTWPSSGSRRRACRRRRSATRTRSGSARRRSPSAARSAPTPRPSPGASCPASIAGSP